MQIEVLNKALATLKKRKRADRKPFSTKKKESKGNR